MNKAEAKAVKLVRLRCRLQQPLISLRVPRMKALLHSKHGYALIRHFVKDAPCHLFVPTSAGIYDSNIKLKFAP